MAARSRAIRAQDGVDEARRRARCRRRPARPARRDRRRRDPAFPGRGVARRRRRASIPASRFAAACLSPAFGDGFADGSEPSERDGRDRARERPVARVDAGIAKRQIRGESLVEGTRQGHGFGDRARRRHPRGQARRGRFGRMRAGPVKSALLSSQTRLVSQWCCRRPDSYTRILGRLASAVLRKAKSCTTHVRPAARQPAVSSRRQALGTDA